MSRISRRSFLGAGLTLWPLARRLSAFQIPVLPAFTRSPFTLGVASGDPAPDGVVLWTRLALDPLEGGNLDPVPVPVHWEVAHDEQFRSIATHGTSLARPEFAHAVHIEVDGLSPARDYWYRFRAGDIFSPAGRTRTTPAANRRVDRVRFAFSSCQNWEQGYFTALKHAADEPIDVMFQLGDFIYEQAGRPGRPRMHLGPRLTTLDHYRSRYAQYRTDPDLQAASAAFPWIVTWDDHEVDDNYAGPFDRQLDPVEQFLVQRAAAYRAYYEHMPLRRGSLPTGPYAQMYRHVAFGDLASFFVLDTRQYRSDQPCNDGVHEPCDGVRDPSATMLGDVQEQWLFNGLHRSARRWHLLPQQVMMARVDLAPGPDEKISMDQWSGYDVPRTRLLNFFATRKPSNPVVLSGDIHNNWVNDLKVDFLDPASPTIGTELVGTSISSGGDGVDFPDSMRDVMRENPFVRFFNSQRGYVRCEVTPDALVADFRVVPYVEQPGAPISTRARFVVENGRAGAERES
ncbi:MAG: alkaline phosphatase D family protein [Acidobacteriaceae bacterium]|jgi:alkaline phosphatase D|nr:alkaline phosphatase D family protein [Acidobacteriaceae bacterium]